MYSSTSLFLRFVTVAFSRRPSALFIVTELCWLDTSRPADRLDRENLDDEPREPFLVEDSPAYGKLGRAGKNHSERSACITSTRAARAAGSIEAATAAPNSTNAETITGNAPGIFKSPK